MSKKSDDELKDEDVVVQPTVITTKTKDYMGLALANIATNGVDFLGRGVIAGDKDFLGRGLLT